MLSDSTKIENLCSMLPNSADLSTNIEASNPQTNEEANHSNSSIPNHTKTNHGLQLHPKSTRIKRAPSHL